MGAADRDQFLVRAGGVAGRGQFRWETPVLPQIFPRRPVPQSARGIAARALPLSVAATRLLKSNSADARDQDLVALEQQPILAGMLAQELVDGRLRPRLGRKRGPPSVIVPDHDAT